MAQANGDYTSAMSSSEHLPPTPFQKASFNHNQEGSPRPQSVHFAPTPPRTPPPPPTIHPEDDGQIPRQDIDRPRSFSKRFMHQTSNIAAGLWRSLLICTVIVGVAMFMAATILVVFTVCSGFGALFLVVGNAVLRRSGHSGYTDDQHAAIVGATGGMLATALFALFSSLMTEPRTTRGAVIETPPALVQLSSSVVTGTLSGAIGSTLLRRNHFDTGGLDILHATRAGAVGGAVMTLAALVFIPIMFATFVCVLPTTLFAFMTSVQWLQDRYEEDWNTFRPVQLPPDDVESGPRIDRMSNEPPAYPDDLPAL